MNVFMFESCVVRFEFHRDANLFIQVHKFNVNLLNVKVTGW